MNRIAILAASFAAAILASCGQNASEGPQTTAEAPPAGPTEIYRSDAEHIVVSLDSANVYVEANCGDPLMDRYLFIHFNTTDGRVINSDFGFDDNAPLVSEGPPARCRSTTPFPTDPVRSVEVGQMVVGGDYIWNITHTLGE